MGDRMRFVSLQSKDVVNVCDGCRIGYVSDIEVDNLCNRIEAIIVEKSSIFNIFCVFKEIPSLRIPCGDIVCIGEDVILVNIPVND